MTYSLLQGCLAQGSNRGHNVHANFSGRLSCLLFADMPSGLLQPRRKSGWLPSSGVAAAVSIM